MSVSKDALCILKCILGSVRETKTFCHNKKNTGDNKISGPDIVHAASLSCNDLLGHLNRTQ